MNNGEINAIVFIYKLAASEKNETAKLKPNYKI
jgi:hypothetical protein